jgi:hypothetical protein
VGWKRHRIKQNQERTDRRRVEPAAQEERAARQETGELAACLSSLGSDQRLDHPANVGRRAALAQAGQAALGNQALLGALQTKLTVSRPGDQYEQEADRVAEIIMTMPDRPLRRQEEEEEELLLRQEEEDEELLLQRQVCPEEEEERLQRRVKSEEEEEKLLQRQVCPEDEEELLQRQVCPEEEEERVQRQVGSDEEEEELLAAGTAGRVPLVTPALEAQIMGLRGGGQPLSAAARGFFEPRFGYDFSGVRIHAGSAAAALARELQAQAFTTGRDIFFARGTYRPRSDTGLHLLAHELTHVVQQGEGDVRRDVIQCTPLDDIRRLFGPEAPAAGRERNQLLRDAFGRLGPAEARILRRILTARREGDLDAEADRQLRRGFRALSSGIREGLMSRLEAACQATAAAPAGEGRQSGRGRETVEEGAPTAEAGPAEEPATYERAQVVLDAVIQILSGFGVGEVLREVEPGRFRLISHPAAHPDVPSQYRDALWDFFKAAHGIETREGEWVRATGQRRLFWITLAMRRIQPLLELALREVPESVEAIEAGIVRPAEAIRAWAREEAAHEAVTAAGESMGEVQAPQTAAMERQIGNALQDAVRVTNDLQTMVNAVPPGEAMEHFTAALEGNPPPGQFASLLRGARVPVAIGTIGEIIGALNAIMSLTDDSARARLFDERLGPLGFTRGMADMLSNVGSLVQGVIASLSALSYAVSAAAGYAAEAARLLSASRVASAGIGRAIAVLNIVKGTIATIHPESTRQERLIGTTDIALGTAALAGGVPGAMIAAGAVSFRVNLEVARYIARGLPGFLWMGLSQCYQRMAREGAEIAVYVNQLLAGQQLIAAESDAGRRATLEGSLRGVETNLQVLLAGLLNPEARENRDPAGWPALRRRFAPCLPPPTERTSRADLIAQARRVLRVIEDCFVNVEQVITEVTADVLQRTAVGTFVGIEDIRPPGRSTTTAPPAGGE